MAGAAAFTALDRGFSLMLVPHRGNGGERQVPSWLDGYVLEDPTAYDPVVDHLLAAGITVVTIGWDPARKSRTAWVSTSAREETRRGLDLLQNRGARSIAFVSGTERNSWNAEAERAYRAWCRDNSARVRLWRVPEAAGEDGGAQAAVKLLKPPAPPDAVFCQTGRHAAGVAAAATGMGFAIPQQLMIMAGSDAEQTRHFRPGITSIDLRPEELGREAVELLADLISGITRRRSCLVEGHLIERASTGRTGTRLATSPKRARAGAARA
jgi:DNA-binding LacI/PurR family transcriptional regulator